MKKTLVLFVFLCYGFIAFAQDIIVLKNNEVIEAVIQEVTTDIIKYKRYNNPEGPIFTILKSDIFVVKYANGDTETFKSVPVNTGASKSKPAAFNSFTFGERLGTWALNWAVLPGLGSYVIMQDWVGGSVMLGLGILGSTLAVIGYYNMSTAIEPSPADDQTYKEEEIIDDDKMRRGLIIAGVGAVILLSNGIYNIVRSASYNKPAPKVTKGFDPMALQFAIVPGKDGIEKASFSYTIKF